MERSIWKNFLKQNIEHYKHVKLQTCSLFDWEFKNIGELIFLLRLLPF
uniref:Uncharacterized protein n=1 Tax=Tetraselmis sp. GSL018 TaxID=582737 RepID=A0A061R254_9CHLO